MRYGCEIAVAGLMAGLMAMTTGVGLLEISLVVAQTVEPRKVEADRLLRQGGEQYQASQFAAALRSWQQALKLYRELKAYGGEGTALGNLGVAYAALGDYGKAIEYYQQYLAFAREVKNRQSEGRALGNLGAAYNSLGNYDKAIVYHEQSLAILREIKDHKGEGAALGNLGDTYYQLSNYAKAIEYQKQSLAIAREIKDRRNEGNSLGHLGLAYDALGNYGKAIEYQEQSLAIAREIKDLQGEGSSLGNLGDTYRTLGNYAKAIEYTEQGLAIAREIKNRRGEGNALGNLGTTYDTLGNYAKAIEYTEQGLAIAREIKNRRGEGNALGNLGVVYWRLGNYAKTIEYQEQRLEIAREIKDRLGEGGALGNLSLASLSLGNYAKAIEYQEQSLTIVREIKDRLREGQSLGNLGLAYLSMGNYTRAIEYQQQSLAIAREIKDRRGEGIALNNLGLVLFKSGKLAAAEKPLMDGIVVHESIRQTGVGNNDANKVSIFEEQARTYRILQEVLVAQNKPNAALEIAERGRARAFVELLAQRLALDQTGRQSTSSVAPSVTQMQQIANAQNATLVQYSILYDDFKLQGKRETRQSELYIWVIPPTGAISFRKIDLKPLWQQNSSLADLVVQGRQSMGVRGRSDIVVALSSERLKQQQEQQTQKLKQLHQLLIQPIAPLLPKDPTQRIIFIPQSELFLVPFPALLNASGQSLIEQHTILTAPSIQVLELTHQQRTRLSSKNSTQNSNLKTQNSLIVGNPTMPKVVTQLGSKPAQLTDLPGAKREALEIAKLFNTQAITGQQATKATIVQQMLNARFIHFATHGLLDDFKGLGVPGAIALAPSGTGQLNDGLLTSNEILDMKLNAELVVLSACDTGRGRITGDGVIGLSRSLITAGVPSIVVSLWKVPDDPTAFLMTEFYKTLQKSPDKAQALRQAMMTTKQKYPDPLNWAAFTFIGEAE